jgi:hypothetical protein
MAFLAQGFTFDGNTLPRNEREAMESVEWKGCMDSEMAQLDEMKVYELVDPPEGINVVGCRWVYDLKKDETGNVVKRKARLVAQGYSQQPGMDYTTTGTFAPVMRFDSLRAMLAAAAIHDWEIRQMDVKGAYLNAQLTEDIYMRQPPGYDDGTGRVCHLKRPLYGLKQAGHEWNRELTAKLTSIGFSRLRSDYSVYLREKGDLFVIVLVWVDDFLTISNSSVELDRFEREIQSMWKVKILDEPSIILGIKISRDRDKGTLSLSQSHYVGTILDRFDFSNAYPVSTLLDPNVKLDIDWEDHYKKLEGDPASIYQYSTLLGSLAYAALATRPDIMHAVCALAQFNKNPQPWHFTAAKRIFQYLKGTQHYTLTYGGTEQKWSDELTTYCDSDGGSKSHRKSISGYIFLLGGGAIAWSSKKQQTTALSTAEAEYVAAVHCFKQVLWFRSFFKELNMPQPDMSTIYSDNQAAISITHHPEFHARTKHLDIALHFIRDHVEAGTVRVIYVESSENLVDFFTKAVPRQAHTTATYGVGVLSNQGGVL